MDLLETKARDLLQIILNRYHAARIYWEYGSKSQVLQQICRLENMGVVKEGGVYERFWLPTENF